MQEIHYDETNYQNYDTSGIRVCKCKNVIMTKKMTNIMIPVGLEFVSARMSLWWKNDQGYDTSDIRVCKCRNVIMMKNDEGYDASGIRVC